MAMAVRPRVLFLTQTHNVWGGIESWFDLLTQWLQNQRLDVRVGLAKGAHFNDPRAFVRAHPQLREPLIMDASPGTEESRVQAIIKACTACTPDVVIPVAIGAVFEAVRRLRQEGDHLRLVVPIHSLHKQYLQTVKDNFDVVDQVVGVSRLIEQFLLRSLPGESARIHYVRNGVTAPLVQRTKSDGPLRVGFIGRLDNTSKRVLDLIPLCKHLEALAGAIELEVFGDGPERSVLEQELLGRVSAGCNVSFHGYLSSSEIYRRAYPSLDVFMLLSATEGNPLTLYEAMQHAVVPVVSRFLGQATEGVVRHGENALTFPIGDMAAAASCLTLLSGDTELLRNLGLKAKEDSSAYSMEESCANWEKLLLQSMEQEPRVPKTSVREHLSIPVGRLENWGLPPKLANSIRTLFGRKFPHESGFDEWPGSQPVNPEALQWIENSLVAIESEASSHVSEEAFQR